MRVAFFQRIYAHYQAGLVKELAFRSKHEFRFFGGNRDPLGSGIEPISEELRNRISYTVCTTRHCGKYLAFQWRSVLVALFGKIDVIILEGAFTHPTTWMAILAARARGKRVLLYTHGWLREESGIKAWFRNTFYRMADGLLLYGNRARQIGLDSGFSDDRLYVVFNSLDGELMQSYREKISEPMCEAFRTQWFGSDGSKPLVVGVGRLTREKQYNLLVEAVARLRQAGQSVNVLLVGEGPDRALIEKNAADLGLNLSLAGAYYDEEFISVCLASADVTVIPGAAGLSVLHSLMYGTPVIVHYDNDHQMPESEVVQEGINGARFSAGDAGDLALAIQRVLFGLPRSPEVAGQCRNTVDSVYSASIMREVFDRAVEGQRPI